MPNKTVAVSGGMDPVHKGHVRMIQEASQFGDVIVILNSDDWLMRKKGFVFMSWEERAEILSAIKGVTKVVPVDDSDGSVCEALRREKPTYFANGGDRTKENIPEMSYQDEKLTFKFGVGGNDKRNSSSWILEEWKNPKFKRPWGWYRVLDDKPGYKVKELVIEPGKSLSMQRHFYRSEHWYVLKGKCDIATEYNGVKMLVSKSVNDTYIIGKNVWHQGQNNYEGCCHILEVQYGDLCIEEDIERRDA